MTHNFLNNKGHVPGGLLLSLGMFSGYTSSQTVSNGVVDEINTEKTLWNLAGDMTFQTSQSPLFVSSTDILDVGIIVSVNGLDANREPVFGLAVLNGQNQTPLLDATLTTPVQMIRENTMNVFGTTSNLISSTHLGTVYLAEEDTLTAGVPDTQTKIRLGMSPQTGISQHGFISVPANHVGVILDFSIHGIANKPVTLVGGVQTFQSNVPVLTRLDPFVIIEGGFLTQSHSSVIALPEGADLHWRIKSPANGAQLSMISSFVTVDSNKQNTIPDAFFGIFS